MRYHGNLMQHTELQSFRSRKYSIERLQRRITASGMSVLDDDKMYRWTSK